MYTRLTNQLMLSASKQNMTDSLSRLYNLQQKASTGQKYANASENPAIAAQGISLRSTQNQLDVYQNTMASTKTWLDTTDQALTQITETLKNAQNTVLQSLSDTQGPDERKIAASAIDGYIQQLVDIGNTEDRGRYIFSGLKTDAKPFVLMSGSSGALVDQIQMNMSVTSDVSGSLILNGIHVDYQPTTNPNEIMIDGHTIGINSKYLTDGVTFNPSYPTYTVDGQSIVPTPANSSGSLNFQGISIYGNTDPAAANVFTVAGSAITAPPNSFNLQPAGSVPFRYNSGSLITSSGSVAPIAGDPNSYYVSGVKITVDATGATPVYSIDGQVVNTGTQGFSYLNDVTVHSGSAFGIPTSGSPFGGLVSGSANLYHDYVAYQGDANTITRTIAPSQNMSVSVNGGAAFNQVNGMFDTLIKLRDALRADDYISPHVLSSGSGPVAYQAAKQVNTNQSTMGYQSTSFINQSPSHNILQAAYGQLQNITNDVSGQLSINGNKLNDLQNAVDRADKAALEIKSQLSQNEEVNMAEAISDVNNQTLVYQAVINMSGRVQNMTTLFDKI
jgi:flagellar hook-associated protein 3